MEISPVKSDESIIVNKSTNETIAESTVAKSVTTTNITVKTVTQQITETKTTVLSAAEEAPKPAEDKNDVEMEDLSADVEMIEAAPLSAEASAEKPVEPKAAAAPKPASVSEVPAGPAKSSENGSAAPEKQAEQKIDDVEKNISNLFNGGENPKARSAISEPDSPLPSQTQEKRTTPAKEAAPKEKPKESASNPAASDNNDLVSILTDGKPENENKAVESAPKERQKEAGVAENKLLSAIRTNATSTPSTTTQTVFNSTPIQKQFDISSENVSTISLTGTDTEHGLGDKSTRLEIISSYSSTAKSPDVSSGAATGMRNDFVSTKFELSLDAVSASDTDQVSSDSLTQFAKTIRNFNGLDGTTTSSNEGGSANPSPSTAKSIVSSTKPDESTSESIPARKSVSASETAYDVQMWYENSELVFLGIERQDAQNKSHSTMNETDKVSSVGSVSSMTEPFPLPARHSAITSTNSTLSTSSLATSDTLKKTKQVVKGTLGLCEFMIEYFQKARHELVDDRQVNRHEETTPVSSGRSRARSALSTPSTPSSAANKRKRGAPTESEEEPKSTKKVRKEGAVSSPVTTQSYPEKAVLARWVDKKFYPGRVVDQKPNNKYVVLFEDGAKKILPEDHIVFGEENILPLQNEVVHALVKGETYEPGFVTSVETKEDGIYYTVECESTTVTVTSSGIYLEEDQAKTILSKRAPMSEKQPEAGYSGGINTRKDRRQKRYS